MRALGCAIDSCTAMVLSLILLVIGSVITVAYWRADGPCMAIFVLMLLIGIGYNSRPFKKVRT